MGKGISCRHASGGGGRQVVALSCGIGARPRADSSCDACLSVLPSREGSRLVRGLGLCGCRSSNGAGAVRRAFRISCAAPVNGLRAVRANIGCVFQQGSDSGGFCRTTKNDGSCTCGRSHDDSCHRLGRVLSTCTKCALECGSFAFGPKLHCRRAVRQIGCVINPKRGFRAGFDSLIPSISLKVGVNGARGVHTNCGVHV